MVTGPDGLSTVDRYSACLLGPWRFFWGMRMKRIISWLLSLPGGFHFLKLTLTWCREEDLPLATALVEGCSCTLESLDIAHTVRCTSIQRPPHFRTDNLIKYPVEPGLASTDLSRRVKLKDATVRVKSRSVKWITIALQTITPEHQGFRKSQFTGPRPRRHKGRR